MHVWKGTAPVGAALALILLSAGGASADTHTVVDRQVRLEGPLRVVEETVQVGSDPLDRPDGYAGAILWEGMLASDDPVVRSANQAVCAAIEAELAAGNFFNETLYPPFKLLYQLAVADPDAPTPFPGFPPGTTNRQAFFLAVTTPQPAPPAFVPGYTLLVGDQDGLTFSDEARLGELVERLNHYEPTVLIRDYTCGLGGETTFTSNLARFTAPVYVVSAGHGFGEFMRANVALLGSTDVTTNFVEEFGHGDHYTVRFHRLALERPMLRWLRSVFRRR